MVGRFVKICCLLSSPSRMPPFLLMPVCITPRHHHSAHSCSPPLLFTAAEIDWSFTILFTVDYCLRFYAAPNFLRYIVSFFPIIDVLTCLPVYLEWIVGNAGAQLNFFRFVSAPAS